MKVTSALAASALILSCLVLNSSVGQANAEDTNSTVTMLAPTSVPVAVGTEPNHIEAYLKVYRKGGYSGLTSEAAILEPLTSDCFSISSISGTALNLAKPYSLSVRYSRSTLLLKIDAFLSTAWNNNAKWQIRLSCERVTPRKFSEQSNAIVEVGGLALKPFVLVADWSYPVDPSAQTAAASKAITTKDKDFEMRTSSLVAGANDISHICASWGKSSNADTLKSHEEMWKAGPAWVSPYSLENVYNVETSSSPTQCWLATDYPQTVFSNVNTIVGYKMSNYLTPDYALIYAVSNNWGLKPLLVAGRTLPSVKLQAMQKFGLKQTVNPAAALSSLKFSSKTQKLEISMSWPKNGSSNQLVEAEILAVDEVGAKVSQIAKYGSKSTSLQLAHGGKWTVSVRTGTQLAWSTKKVSSIDVPGKPFVGKNNPYFIDAEDYQNWNPMAPQLQVGKKFETKLNVYGSPKPKTTTTYFDCGETEARESVTLTAGCKSVSSKIVSGLVPSSLLDHFVLAKITAVNSFGQDSIYTQTTKVQHYYGGGLSIKIKDIDKGIFELVGKADWGSVKPQVTVLDWVIWDAQGNNMSPIIGSKGKKTITTSYLGSDKYIGVKIKAVSKDFGTMNFFVSVWLSR